MIRISCPDCNFWLYDYQDGTWTVYVCWNCGHYESNSPAFKSTPYLFMNMVRDNPILFARKFCSPTESQQRNKTPDDSTEHENVSTLEDHELDYRRRLARIEFTKGLSREELMQKINTPKSSHKSDIHK